MRTEKDILKDVRALAIEYYELTGKPLGVTGEIAEYEAATKLGLELSSEARTPGWDAVRRGKHKEEKIQIKGRFKQNGKKWGRVSSINIVKEFDSVVLVLMFKEYEVHQIWEAPRDAVVARLNAPGSNSRNERGAMSVSQFISIAKQVWP